MNFQNTPYFDYKLFSGSLNNIFEQGQLVINTINQYSFCIAEEDVNFKRALVESDILLPDGIAVVWSNLILNRSKIKKIAGADIHDYLLENLNKKHGKCFYLGASVSTLDKIRNKINSEYPNISFESYSPPYKSEFSDEESEEMINQVNSFKPDVLFVGMTAPKQEKWVNKHKHLLDSTIICSIGAVFDFYAGTIQRPGKIWIMLGMEWFGRFVREPRRMWKRYFFYGPIFLIKTMFEKQNKKGLGDITCFKDNEQFVH
ncbi:WecB/TagA/CpsF family glycosyltransferase [Rhodonellum sp.]|uniref:WecB/TagA/CpsF family glycosyltransferase n=1 Tax=Rhodonellum sp. TaxID=2231180 RepID=UPI00272349F7|nr:WecB/TagA/CpsF family glycosyltransferase [Rhodonellum sp.]MDO9551489.1 WecB/TagA/CpsF family glycosyltransferase [Rhodonellum sp.]